MDSFWLSCEKVPVRPLAFPETEDLYFLKTIPGYQIEVPVVVFFNPASKDSFEAGVTLTGDLVSFTRVTGTQGNP